MAPDLFAAMRERYFGAGVGVRFEPGTPKTVTVGTTATELLAANPQRVRVLIVNWTANAGHLDYENKVSATRGYPVTQNGGHFGSSFDEDGETVQSAFHALNETAGGDWYVVAWELTERRT